MAILARDPAERSATMRAGLQSSEHVASMLVLTRVRGGCPPRTNGQGGLYHTFWRTNFSFTTLGDGPSQGRFASGGPSRPGGPFFL